MGTSMIKVIVVPLISMILGLLGLFRDPKDLRKRWITWVIFALIISTAVVNGYLTHSSAQASAAAAAAAKATSDSTSAALESKISDFSAQLKAMTDAWASLMTQFGRTSTEPASTEQVVQSALAQRAISKSVILGARTTTVEYYPKQVDGTALKESLEALNFNFRTGPVRVADIPTNSIWYGSAVPVEDVKLAALSLIRAGAQIRQIAPLQNSSGPRAHLIQVGAKTGLDSLPAWTVEALENFKLNSPASPDATAPTIP